jgi:hypothetical protein
MDAVQRTLWVIVPSPKQQKSHGERNRRTRLSKALDPELAGWLRRVARCHAHLCAVVRLYGRPESAGGRSNNGDDYSARAARGDRTLLHDALMSTGDELYQIADDVQDAIGVPEPTSHRPGTPGKIDVLSQRSVDGKPLFVRGDAPIDLR